MNPRCAALLVTVAITASAVAASGCTTAYVVDGRRVDDPNNPDREPPVQRIRPAEPSGRRAHGRQATPRIIKVPRARRRRFARHGDDLVRGWRYGAVGDPRLSQVLDRAEDDADEDGRRILQTGRAMVLRDRVVIRGSCWTFADAVYKRAGFKRRRSVFKSRKGGPYADADSLRPGDFLSYINHSWHGSVHSAIFVGWLDRDAREGLMLSYVGSRKAKPGGYRSYLLTHVYRVQRPRPPGRALARGD